MLDDRYKVAGSTQTSTELARSLERFATRAAIEIPATRDRLTYRDLRDGAGELLRGALATSRAPWVICLEKRPQYYVALTAAFLGGRRVCLVDPAVPPSRLASILSQFDRPQLMLDRHSALLAASELQAWTPQGSQKSGLVTLTQNGDGLGRAEPDDSAKYYIATSGSSGPPKLVEVRHDATCAFTDWACAFYGIEKTTRWAQVSSAGFDLSLVDFLTVLKGGGTLVAMSTWLERIHPAAFVDQARITHWHSVPSMLASLLRGGGLTALRCVTLCGEPLLKTDCRRLRKAAPNARLVNTYGPTEGTLFCSFHEVTKPDLSDEAGPSITIGVPIPGWNFVFVDDDQGQRLVIVSNHLAEGYLGERNSKFGEITLYGQTLRTFDSGDYFVVEPAGVRFSHRADRLVKIQGNRLDLGEVEEAVLAAGAAQAVATVRAGRVVVIVENEGAIDSQALMVTLRQTLPAYARPIEILRAEALPRLANGKIDRARVARDQGRAGNVGSAGTA